MTTENLDLPTELDAQLGRIAGQVRQRVQEVGREVDGERQHQGNLALGVSALIQRSEDRVGELNHERGQLDEITRRAARLLAVNGEEDGNGEGDEPLPEPPAPPTPSDGGDDLDDTPRTPRESVDPSPTAEQRPIRIPERLNPANWSWMQWVTAIVMALVAFVIFYNTRHWPELGGFPKGLFAFVWTTAGTTFGFGVGGFLGWFFTDHAEGGNE